VKFQIKLLCTLLSIFLFIACKNDLVVSTVTPKASVVPVDVSKDIVWHNITDAKELATKEGKDIFLFAHAPWCPKCEEYQTSIFKDPELINKLNTHFISVKFNTQETKEIVWEGKSYTNANYDHSKGVKEVNNYHDLNFEIGVETIPNILVMDQDLNTLSSIQGLQDANRLKWQLSNATGRFYYMLKS